MKKRIAVFCIALILAINSIILIGCKNEIPYEDLPINYIHATFVTDLSNPQKIMGLMDYAFIGYVEEQLDMYYINDLPYQNYQINVLENIKGELIIGKSVVIEKCGGIAKDKKSIFMFENDFLPEVGKVYLFMTMVGSEDTMGSNGPYTVVELESGINADSMKNASFATALSNSDVLQKYIDAYENEIPFERERTEYIQQD